MGTFSDWALYLLAAAVLQNFVLSTGFGTSIAIRTARRPGDILLLGGLLTSFCLGTLLLSYPLNLLIGTDYWAKLFRPLLLIVITAVLYILVTVVLRKRAPGAYDRVRRLLPLAAFNNVVVGIALIANQQLVVTFWGVVGLGIGTCIGLVLLCKLTAEAMERTDHPDMPGAFRGLPSTLVFLGLLALALLGFSSSVQFL